MFITRSTRKTPTVRMAVAAGALVLAVAGCGGEEPGATVPDDPDAVEGSITFWTYPIGESGEDAYWEPIVAEFEKEYPNVEVDVVVQPWDKREETLVTSIAGNQGPDVVYFNPDFIPKFAVEGTLEPLDGVISDDVDDFKDAALESMTWDDTLYGVPLLMQALTPVCNTEVLAALAATCPTTWDELEALGAQAKAAGYYATDYVGALTLTLNHSFYPFLWQAGGEVLNEDGTAAAFNSPEGLRALEFLQTIYANEWSPAGSITTAELPEQSAFVKGEVATITSGGEFQLRPFMDEALLEVGPPLTDKEQVAAGSVGGLSVLSASESKEAAMAWVDFLTSPEQMAAFDENNGYFAPRDSVTGLYADDPKLQQIEGYLDYVRTGVIHPQARELMDLIKPHIQAVLLGKIEPQEALDKAEAEVNGLLERG